MKQKYRKTIVYTHTWKEYWAEEDYIVQFMAIPIIGFMGVLASAVVFPLFGWIGYLADCRKIRYVKVNTVRRIRK